MWLNHFEVPALLSTNSCITMSHLLYGTSSISHCKNCHWTSNFDHYQCYPIEVDLAIVQPLEKSSLQKRRYIFRPVQLHDENFRCIPHVTSKKILRTTSLKIIIISINTSLLVVWLDWRNYPSHELFFLSKNMSWQCWTSKSWQAWSY